MSQTERLGLPLLAAGQAQKEITHNEALALIDLIASAGVEAAGVNDPPVAPQLGACWIVGQSPTGAWAGQAGRIAGWTAGGWRFVPPVSGMRAWNAASGMDLIHTGSQWVEGIARVNEVRVGADRVVAARQPAIAAPSGGVTVDAQARIVIESVLNALRAHGLIGV